MAEYTFFGWVGHKSCDEKLIRMSTQRILKNKNFSFQSVELLEVSVKLI